MQRVWLPSKEPNIVEHRKKKSASSRVDDRKVRKNSIKVIVWRKFDSQINELLVFEKNFH